MTVGNKFCVAAGSKTVT